MSDTSLVFNLVARDNATEELGRVREKFDAAAAGIGAGVAAGLGVGIAANLDMEAANAKLTAQLGVGPAEAAELSKVSADVYANAWGDSTATVNDAIKGVYQNIGDVSGAEGGLEGVTTKALALSQTFDQEVGPTTAAVGQLIRTGLAKDADEAFDILTAGFQSGANKADDLLDTMGEYSTQFRRIGLDGQTATGLLAQGLKAGARDADQVADAIGQFGELTLSNSTTVQAAFQSIGLDADTMAAKIGQGGKSGQEALQMTLDALRGTKDETVKLNAATALFGDPGTVMGDALFALDPAGAAAATGMDKAAGSTDKLVKTMGDSPASALESFKRKAVEKLAEVGGVFVQFGMDHQEVFGPLAATLGIVAGAILAVSVAQRIYATYTAIASAAQAIWNAEIWASTAALLANPMTWIVLAIIALIAVIVLIATKTTWFQQLWSWVWGGITSFTRDAIGWISDALDWFSGLGDMFAGWWGSAKHWAVTKMTELVTWVTGLPGRLWAVLSGLGSFLWDVSFTAFQNLKNAAVNRATSLVSWIGGLPGRLVGALGAQTYRFYNMGLDFVTGLWDGISAAGGWLWNQVKNFASNYVVAPVKSLLQIGSPSKLAADEIGHWIPAGIAMGVEDNASVVDKAMRGLVDPAVYRPSAQSTAGMAPLVGAAPTLGGAQAQQRIVFEFVGGSRAFREFFQESVRNTAGGSVVKFAEG